MYRFLWSLLFVLSCFFQQSIAQIMDSSQYNFVAYWEIGDSLKYSQKKATYRSDLEGNVLKDETLIAHVRFDVVDATDSTYAYKHPLRTKKILTKSNYNVCFA